MKGEVSHYPFPGWLETARKEDRLPVYERELLHWLTGRYGPPPESVATALVYLSMHVRAGHVSLPLDRPVADWQKSLRLEGLEAPPECQVDKSALLEYPAVSNAPDSTPFLVDGRHLYFRKQWQEERAVARELQKRSVVRPADLEPDRVKQGLNEVFSDTKSDTPDWQKVAGMMVLLRPLVILSGGPGTGKTTTVARIVRLMHRVYDRPIRLALTAPTGKAAARMNDSMETWITETEGAQWTGRESAGTLHRLLQRVEERGLLPPGEPETLPYDLVVVDEASMVDLSLIQRLLTHLDEKTRLLIVGDKDQLASVEAGSVLADLCTKKGNRFSESFADEIVSWIGGAELPGGGDGGFDDAVVYLEKTWRFDESGGIGPLAADLREGRTDRVVGAFQGRGESLRLEVPESPEEGIRQAVRAVSERLLRAHDLPESELLDFWSREIWLTPLRRGPFGSAELNKLAEQHVRRQIEESSADGWFHGRPVLITRNDYSLNLFNGDLGVCSREDNGLYRLLVRSGDDRVRRIPVSRVREIEPAGFLTVHKTQGSEFRHVNLLLPDRDTPLLTRELLYTAVTRAQNSLTLFGRPELLRKGVARLSERYTGLSSLMKSGSLESRGLSPL